MRGLDKLPNGWVRKKIPEVLFFQEGPGVRKTQFTTSGVKLLNVGNINEGKLNLGKTKLHVSEEEAFGKYKHFLVDEGDLLIACSGIVVDNFHNKIAYAKKEHLPLCLNTSTLRFKVLKEDELYLDYFRYFLQTDFFKGQLRRLITGSAQLNFGPSHLKQIEVILPPLEEQKRIAAVLDKADRLRQKDRQLLAKYDQLLQSVFLDMFGDLSLNGKSWEISKLGDVLDKIQIGPFGSLLHVEDYVAGGIPLINPTHIKKLKIHPDFDFTVSLEKFNELKNYHLKVGDVILGRRGEMGRCALVTEKEDGWLCGTGSLFLTPSRKISSVYLTYLLSREGIKKRLEKDAKGITMLNLNRTILQNFKIPVPPLEVQKNFEVFTIKLENQISLVNKSIKISESLYQSLLQKAFKGELESREVEVETSLL
jgi:type I restriction enzyme, S subunit